MWQGGIAMKVGRLITEEGIEFSLDNSQLREFIDRLRRQEANEAIAAELSLLVDASGFIDPEDYERAAQAAYFARRAKKLPAAA
jgi:predicted nucleic acid-binding protein